MLHTTLGSPPARSGEGGAADLFRKGQRNVEANPKPHSETVKDDSGLLEDAIKVDTDSIMQENRARLDTTNMARMISWRCPPSFLF